MFNPLGHSIAAAEIAADDEATTPDASRRLTRSHPETNHNSREIRPNRIDSIEDVSVSTMRRIHRGPELISLESQP